MDENEQTYLILDVLVGSTLEQISVKNSAVVESRRIVKRGSSLLQFEKAFKFPFLFLPPSPPFYSPTWIKVKWFWWLAQGPMVSIACNRILPGWQIFLRLYKKVLNGIRTCGNIAEQRLNRAICSAHTSFCTTSLPLATVLDGFDQRDILSLCCSQL